MNINKSDKKPVTIDHLYSCPDISVVITCYNSEKYLPSAIKSIINQSQKNIEIIIVNDCSRGDFSTIEKIFRCYPQIKFVYNKNNMGLFYSRLAGFKASKGKYVGFCDADDMISFDFYRKLLNLAVIKDADMAAGDVALYYHDVTNDELSRAEVLSKYLNLDILFNSNLELTGTDVFDFFMKQAGLCYTLHVIWNKIYKRELFQSCFEEYILFLQKSQRITTCEDIAFSHLLWLKAKKVVNAHNIFYFYRRHNASETTRRREKRDFVEDLRQLKSVFSFFHDNLVKYGKYEKYREKFADWLSLYSRFWYAHILNYSFAKEFEDTLKDTFCQQKLQVPKLDDNYYLSVESELGESFRRYENIKRTICANEIEYISFDVFDTLLLRPVLNPDDIFHILTQKVNKFLGSRHFIDFHQIRTEAERECRQRLGLDSPREDITLDEIYNYIVEKFSIGAEDAKKIKEFELEAEYKLSFPRKLGRELYDLAVQRGKRIICISDMYLPATFIEKLLAKNGYDKHEKIFVSSEYGLLKGTKNLYYMAARELDIEDLHTMLHIGDNLDTDIHAANEAGIWGGYLPNISACIFGNIPDQSTGKIANILAANLISGFNFKLGLEGFAGLRSMLGLVAMKLFEEQVICYNKDADINCQPYKLGYFLLGMHLFAIADWLARHYTGNSTIHFVGRDGYLPWRALKIIRPDIKTNYIYISRKVSVSLLLCMSADPKTFSTFIRWDNISPHTLWVSLKGITIFETEGEFTLFSDIHAFPYYKCFDNLSQFINFINIISSDALDRKKCTEFKEIACKYFGKMINNGDIIFDIGYSGRTEELLVSLLNIKLSSFYLYNNLDNCSHRQNLFCFRNHIFYKYTPQMFCALREMLYSEVSSSCIGYKIVDGTLEPIFEKYLLNFSSDACLKIIQNAALDFIKDYTNIFRDYVDSLHFRVDDASAPFEYFLHHAGYADKKLFSSTIFEDDLFGGRSLNIEEEWRMLQEGFQAAPVAGDGNVAARETEIATLRDERDNLQKLIEAMRQDIEIDKENALRLQVELDDKWTRLCVAEEKLGKEGQALISSASLEKLAMVMAIPAPPDFDEAAYLHANPDVRHAIEAGMFHSAFCHYILHGRKEGRKR